MIFFYRRSNRTALAVANKGKCLFLLKILESKEKHGIFTVSMPFNVYDLYTVLYRRGCISLCTVCMYFF
jgi:hypothetical protein